MRYRFNAPPHHTLTFGPDDDPVLVVHGGEVYDHPEGGFSVPRQAEPVDEEARPDPDPDPDDSDDDSEDGSFATGGLVSKSAYGSDRSSEEDRS